MTSRFKTKLRIPAACPGEAPWAFIVLPKAVSAKMPRRGRITVDASINGDTFRAILEPDGKLSHWLRVDEAQFQGAGAKPGDKVEVTITSLKEEPDPKVPPDLHAALAAAPEALAVWKTTTHIARVDWIHWIESAKQAKTRVKRIENACQMLASGKKHVCCFDTSGYYSKALAAPKEMT